MDFKKLVPWNWFRKEEEETGAAVPTQHTTSLARLQRQFYGSIGGLLQEMDQLSNNFFRGGGHSSFRTGGHFSNSLAHGLIKPTLDIGASDEEYVISIEVPGVERKDIRIEITNSTLTVSGEKKQEKEEKKKDYYRMERFYGAFQRVLSLPEDANQDEVKATFKSGVLVIRMPKKAFPGSKVKQVEIK